MLIVDIKLIAHITFKVYDKYLQTDTSAFLWLTDQQKRRLFTIKSSPASAYWLYLSTASVNVTLFNLIWDKVTCKNLTLQNTENLNQLSCFCLPGQLAYLQEMLVDPFGKCLLLDCISFIWNQTNNKTFKYVKTPVLIWQSSKLGLKFLNLIYKLHLHVPCIVYFYVPILGRYSSTCSVPI